MAAKFGECAGKAAHQLLDVRPQAFCSGSVWAVATVWEASEQVYRTAIRAMAHSACQRLIKGEKI